MILTREEIIKEISRKRIKIIPFAKKSIGPASIDLTLSNKIRVFKPNSSPIVINESIDYKNATKIVDLSNGYILKPGELVLGITKETIHLPKNICGWLNSRSKFARVGLMSHISAPFICPGVSNKQVLEIFNAGKKKLKLVPGIKICQLVLQECRGNAEYKGIFREQEL